MANGEIVIRNEDDAWLALKNALAGAYDDGLAPEITLKGWPTFEIIIYLGEGALTPTLMGGFIAFQDAIYRSYAILKRDSRLKTALTLEEKKALEFSVIIEKGSTLGKIELDDLFKRIAKILGEKLEAKHWVIIVIALGLMITSGVVVRGHLDGQVSVQLEEIKSREKLALIEQLKFSTEADIERLNIFAQAVGSHKHLPRLSAEMDEARQSILKDIGETADAELAGVLVDREIAEQLAKNPRRISAEIIVTGSFRILKVDTTHVEGFRVTLQRVSDGLRLVAGIRDIMISEEQRGEIKEAEWAKKPINLVIDAKRVGEEIRDAIIRDVEHPEG